MSSEQVQFLTPVGRIVMGSIAEGRTTDQQGRPLTTLQGQPKTQYFIGLAVPKNSPDWEPFWQQIVAIGQRDWPGGQWNTPGFAWKVLDGDTVQNNPHCAGHYLIKMTSGFAPTCVDTANNPIDPTIVKRGYWVRCYVGVKGNDNTQKPGVYVNHELIQLVGYGEEIVGGTDPNQAFAQPVAHMPAGVSQTPVAPAADPTQPAPAQPAQPAPTQPAPAQPAQPAPTQPAPATTVPAGAPGLPVSVVGQAETIASPSDVQPHPGILNPQPGGPVR